MQAVDSFERNFARRLRAELDGIDVRTPAARPAPRTRRGRAFWRVARPLALAMAATVAFAALATAATGSPEPGQWLRPSEWTSRFNPPLVTPSDEPAAAPSPSEAVEPSENPAQSPATEHEPSESPSSGQHRESPEPAGSEGPTSGPSPGEGGDG